MLTEQKPPSDIYDLLLSQEFTLLTSPSDPNLIWLRNLTNGLLMLRRFSVTFSLFSMVLDGILAGFALRISGPIRPLLNGLPRGRGRALPHPPAGRTVLHLPGYLGGYHAGLRRVRWAQEPACGG